MAETYPLAFPTVTGLSKISLSVQNVTAISTSPISLSQQVMRRSGQAWGASVIIPPMNRAEAEVWVAFQLRLRGRYGTFLMGDPVGQQSRGIASWWAGTPLVKGATQTGETLVIDGAPASQTAYLMTGDYIQIGSGVSTRLHKVLQDADSDATGTVTLNLWPDISISPADNAPVLVKNTQGIFRLASNTTQWDIGSAVTYGISFGVAEAQ